MSIFPAPWNATLKIFILDLLILFHFYGFFAYVYVYTEHMEARIGCRTPEMELHMVGRHHVGAGNLISISERAERSLNH